jgi:hypothetical protein
MMGARAEAKAAAARLLAPLLAWFAIGWWIYPYATEYLGRVAEEDVDIAEVRLFSLAAMVGCLIAAAACAAYAWATRDITFTNPWIAPVCPYCDSELIQGSGTCPACSRPVGKT